MAITLYGIKNCDSCRKARRWLDTHGLNYRFHDLRDDGLDEGQVQRWCDELGWENVINRRGTTYRQLPPDVKENMDASRAVQLMTEQPTLVKRPVVDTGSRRHVGFKETEYGDLFR